jgi:hypothetical protein
MNKWPLTEENTTIPEGALGFRKILMLTIPRAVMKDRPILFGDISENYPKYKQIFSLFFRVCYETLHYRGHRKNSGKEATDVGVSQMPSLAVTHNPTAEELQSSAPADIDNFNAFSVNQESSLLTQINNLPYGSDFAQQDIDDIRQSPSSLPAPQSEEDEAPIDATPVPKKRKSAPTEKRPKKSKKKKKTTAPAVHSPDRPRIPPPAPLDNEDDEEEEEDDVSDDEDEIDESPRVGEMYMESVMDAEKKNVTHYVFYFLIKSPRMFPNRRMAALINGNAKRLAFHLKKSKEPEKFQDFELWKHITTNVDLAKLLGYYLNTNDDMISTVATTYDLHDRNNPVCAELFFHRATADSLRASVDTNPTQHIFNYSAGSRFKLRFPEPSFVYKLRTSDISPIAVMQRCLPDYQQRVMLSTYNVISNAFDREESKTILPTTMTDDPELLDWLHKQYGGFQIRKVGTYSGALEMEYENYNNYEAGLYGKIKSIVEKYRQLMTDAIPAMKRKAPQNPRPLARSIELGISGGGISKRRTKSQPVKRNGKVAEVRRSPPKHLQRLIFLITSQFAFDAYDRLCRGAYPGLSPTGEKIQHYIQTDKLLDRMDHFVGKDKPTDTFHLAHVQRFYTSMKDICYLVQNQNIASLCWKYGMTAYMVDFNNVKNHMMLNAERGGGGKSESIATINRLRIPETHEVFTFATPKSFGGDSKQQSDAIYVMDEMSQRDMDPKYADGERVFKSIMSNNRYAIAFMSLGADGSRTGSKRQNEWIISLMATNNERFLFTQIMTPAYQRRWHIISFDESMGQDADKNISNTQLLQMYETQKTESSGAMKKLERAFRIEQAMVFDTFKLIYIGALQKISQHLTSVFMWCLNDYLPSHNYPTPTPADERYILNLIDVEVVLDAIRAVFINDLKSPDDPDRHKPIQIKSADFHQVDRYLYVCVRHIVSALGEAGDKLLDPFEYDVRTCLRLLLIEKLNTTDYAFVFSRHLPSSGNAANFSAAGVQKTDQEKLDEIDFTYCNFYVTDGLTSLARQIQRLMFERRCPITPSVDRILYSLIKFTKRPFAGYSNTHHEIGGPHESALLKDLKMSREVFKKTDLGKMSYIGNRFVMSPLSVPREVYRNPPATHTSIAARLEPRAKSHVYVVHRDFLVDVGKPHKDVLQDFIRHMLSFRYQEKERYAFGVQREKRNEQEILDIPAAKPDATIFKLKRYSATTCDNIRAAERLGLDLGEFKAKTISITIPTTFDLWACERRNEDTGFIKTAVGPDIYHCDELFADKIRDMRFLNDSGKSFFMGISMNIYNFVKNLTPAEIVEKLQDTLRRSSANTAKFQSDVDFDPNVALVYRKPKPRADDEGEDNSHLRPKEPPLYHWETIIGNNGNRMSYLEYLEQSRGCGFRQLYESNRNSTQRRVVFNHNRHLYKWILPHHGIQDHLYALQQKSRLSRTLEPFFSLAHHDVDDDQIPEYRPDSSSPQSQENADFDGVQIDHVSSPILPPPSRDPVDDDDASLVVEEEFIRACGEENSFDLEKLIEKNQEDEEEEENEMSMLHHGLRQSLVDMLQDRNEPLDVVEPLDEEEEEEEEEEDDSDNESRPPVNATTREINGVVYDIIN